MHLTAQFSEELESLLLLSLQVFELLQRANNPEGIIQAVPELINAKILASVLITINKW